MEKYTYGSGVEARSMLVLPEYYAVADESEIRFFDIQSGKPHCVMSFEEIILSMQVYGKYGICVETEGCIRLYEKPGGALAREITTRFTCMAVNSKKVFTVYTQRMQIYDEDGGKTTVYVPLLKTIAADETHVYGLFYENGDSMIWQYCIKTGKRNTRIIYTDSSTLVIGERSVIVGNCEISKASLKHETEYDYDDYDVTQIIFEPEYVVALAGKVVKIRGNLTCTYTFDEFEPVAVGLTDNKMLLVCDTEGRVHFF